MNTYRSRDDGAVGKVRAVQKAFSGTCFNALNEITKFILGSPMELSLIHI